MSIFIETVFAKYFWAKMLAGAALAGAMFIFLFLETELSFSKIIWHHRFKQEIRETGGVELGRIVSFRWEQIELLRPYDVLAPELQDRLSFFNKFWWYGDARYWTAVYHRVDKPPFLIRVNVDSWNLARFTQLKTSDQNARLRLIRTGSVDQLNCAPPASKCLTLSDAASPNSIQPNADKAQ